MRITGIICFIMIIISVGTAFSLEEGDVRVRENQLTQLGFRIVDEMFCVSVQAGSLYNLFEKGLDDKTIPAPRKQFYISTDDGTSRSTIYYYEFPDRDRAETALHFIRPFIWGDDKPSPLHPERIINLDNYVIVISSSSPNHFDRLLLEQVIYMPIPSGLAGKLHARIREGSDTFDSPRGILKAFQDGENLPLTFPGPFFGESWEVDTGGNIRNHFYEIMEIRNEGGIPRGFWTPIKPDNDSEKAQIDRILDDGKKGIKPVIPQELASFLNGIYGSQSSDIVTREGGQHFIAQQGNVAYIRRTSRGYILIVTSEHWTGKPCPFIVAYFWNR